MSPNPRGTDGQLTTSVDFDGWRHGISYESRIVVEVVAASTSHRIWGIICFEDGSVLPCEEQTRRPWHRNHVYNLCILKVLSVYSDLNSRVVI
jgi:hypothetical protein